MQYGKSAQPFQGIIGPGTYILKTINIKSVIRFPVMMGSQDYSVKLTYFLFLPVGVGVFEHLFFSCAMGQDFYAPRAIKFL